MDRPVRGRGRIFGGASPPTGEDAQFTIEAEVLLVNVGEVSYTAPLSSLRVREVGTGTIGLELAWDADAAPRALHVFDQQSLQALRTDPRIESLPQMQHLRSTQRRQSIGRTFGWTAVAIFVLFPVLVVLIFIWQADRIAAAAANRISIEQEAQFGDKAFAAMRGSLDLVESGPALEAVQRLGQRLSEGSKFRYRFYVAKNDAVNAFAMPGGIIVVHTGLIDATRRPEELAGVLAHEVQHVEQRHSLHALVKDLGLRGLWLMFTGDLGGGLIGHAALELTSLQFSRGAEAQADEKGFDQLIRAGIDPSGMADFFVILSKQEGEIAPPPFLSTHPASVDRETALRERLAALGGQTFEPLALGPWPPPSDRPLTGAIER